MPSNVQQNRTFPAQLPATSLDRTSGAVHQDGGQHKLNDHEQAHACSVFDGRSGDEERARRLAQPTTPKMGTTALPEQPNPKLGTIGRAAERRGSRQQGCKKSPKAGGAGSGGESLPASSEGGGGAPATSSRDSNLVGRNDSILKSLFSGGLDGGAGNTGVAGDAGFSHEFGLWKRAKKAYPRSTETNGDKIEAELPPPPLQGVDQAVTAVDKDVAGPVGGVCDGAVRPSLGSTRTPTVGGGLPCRFSPPPIRTAPVILPVFTNLITNPRHGRDDEGAESAATGSARDERTPTPNTLNVTRGVETPILSAESAGGGENHARNIKDAVSPPPILPKNSPNETRGPGRSPSPRLSPRAARAKNRLCTEASVVCDSGPGTGGPGRLRGLKASPPPGSGRLSSALRVEGSLEDVRIGRSEEGDRGSCTGGRGSCGGVGSGLHASQNDDDQHTKARAMVPISPPPLLLEGSQIARYVFECCIFCSFPCDSVTLAFALCLFFFMYSRSRGRELRLGLVQGVQYLRPTIYAYNSLCFDFN